jgi:nucleoside phosphorylase/CheY-like chemotaxis protein
MVSDLKILIVEDNAEKYGRIHSALIADGVDPSRVDHRVSASEAVEKLKACQYDLLLLDVNIPLRPDGTTKRGGGLEVLKSIRRDADCYTPTYIVGITQFEDVMEEFGEAFEEQLWSLVFYSDVSDRWVTMLRMKLEYIKAVKVSQHFTDGQTFGVDLAIVCALNTVELDAIRKLPCDWQHMRLRNDETRYLSGQIQTDGQSFSVVAASAPRMGMPSAAVISSKIIQQFRPRYIAMVGICGGRNDKVNIGDVIVADPSWDWGSGKITSKNGKPFFDPAPHQLALDVDLSELINEMSRNNSDLAKIKQSVSGKKPDSELRVHVAPLVSGAAVVADQETFTSLLSQHRNIHGLEMEAYGVVSAALGNGKPRPTPIVAKAVSDYADADKEDGYQEYAANVSAKFIFEAAKKFLKLNK